MDKWEITWADVGHCFARMQGRQMNARRDSIYGALLYMAAVRRASWRSQRPPTTAAIVRYYERWQVDKVPQLRMRLTVEAYRFGFSCIEDMVEELAR